MQTTTHKAWVSAATTLALALAARFSGMIEMPELTAIQDAAMTLGGALVASAVSWLVTWLVPNKPKE